MIENKQSLTKDECPFLQYLTLRQPTIDLLGFSWCGICQTELKIVFVVNDSLDLVLFTVDLAWISTNSASRYQYF